MTPTIGSSWRDLSLMLAIAVGGLVGIDAMATSGAATDSVSLLASCVGSLMQLTARALPVNRSLSSVPLTREKLKTLRRRHSYFIIDTSDIFSDQLGNEAHAYLMSLKEGRREKDMQFRRSSTLNLDSGDGDPLIQLLARFVQNVAIPQANRELYDEGPFELEGGAIIFDEKGKTPVREKAATPHKHAEVYLGGSVTLWGPSMIVEGVSVPRGHTAYFSGGLRAEGAAYEGTLHHAPSHPLQGSASADRVAFIFTLRPIR